MPARRPPLWLAALLLGACSAETTGTTAPAADAMIVEDSRASVDSTREDVTLGDSTTAIDSTPDEDTDVVLADSTSVDSAMVDSAMADAALDVCAVFPTFCYCSTRGSPCCSGSMCGGGLTCTGGYCVGCGLAGEKCCGSAPSKYCTGADTFCEFSGYCRACGGLGQTCCPPSYTCREGSCNGGICK